MLRALVKRRLFGLRWRWEKLNNRFYDWRHGTETHQETFLTEQGLSEAQAIKGNDVYRPFWRKEFNDAIKSLGIDPAEYVFVDIGSGKGKLLLLASNFSFADVVGVEHAVGLHLIAMKNIDSFESRATTKAKISSINADALTWNLPNRSAIYFLYNPFDPGTTKSFVERLDKHVAGNRLPTFMIYGNLRGTAEREEAFQSLQCLRLMFKSPRYLVFCGPG